MHPSQRRQLALRALARCPAVWTNNDHGTYYLQRDRRDIAKDPFVTSAVGAQVTVPAGVWSLLCPSLGQLSVNGLTQTFAEAGCYQLVARKPVTLKALTAGFGLPPGGVFVDGAPPDPFPPVPTEPPPLSPPPAGRPWRWRTVDDVVTLNASGNLVTGNQSVNSPPGWVRIEVGMAAVATTIPLAYALSQNQLRRVFVYPFANGYPAASATNTYVGVRFGLNASTTVVTQTRGYLLGDARQEASFPRFTTPGPNGSVDTFPTAWQFLNQVVAYTTYLPSSPLISGPAPVISAGGLVYFSTPNRSATFAGTDIGSSFGTAINGQYAAFSSAAAFAVRYYIYEYQP